MELSRGRTVRVVVGIIGGAREMWTKVDGFAMFVWNHRCRQNSMWLDLMQIEKSAFVFCHFFFNYSGLFVLSNINYCILNTK